MDHFEIDACDRSRLTSELIASLDFKTLNDIPLVGKQGAREIVVMLWRRGIALRGISAKLRTELQAEYGWVEDNGSIMQPCIWDGWLPD